MAENRELALVLKLVADQFKNELKVSQGALGSFNNFIKDWKTQLTAAGAALFAIAKSTANYGDELLKTSQKVGVGVEALAGLQHAAKLADLDNQQLATGLKFLSTNMVEVFRHTEDGESLFRALGVSAVDATGKLRPTEQVLLDVAEAFAAHADGAGKTETAVKLFGKSGMEMIPFLNAGKTGIKELMEEARRLGLVMSEEDAKASEKFNDELTRLEAAVNGVKLAVGTALIPAMTTGAEALTSIIAQMRRLNDETTNVAQNLKNLSDAFGQTRMGQGMMDTFTALGFGHRKGEGTLPREQFWFDLMKSGGGLKGQVPGSGVLAPGAGGSDDDAPQMGQLADQEKLGKALLEIHLAKNRAIDIENKLRTEGADLFRLQTDRQLQREQEDAAFQERQGQRIVERTQLDVAIREAAAAQERDQLVKNLQAWVQYDEQVGASSAQRYAHQLDLVRANLAQQTQLTREESGRLLLAWQNHDWELAPQILARTTLTAQQKETIELQSLARVAAANEQTSDDLFAGWARGMQRYVADTKSGFGMAADLARRTAQQMEQSFRTFFFDLFEGKVNSLKDVLRGLLDFVKQIAAQIAAQLAVSFVLKSFTGGGGGFGDIFSGFFGGEKSGPSVQPAGLFGRAELGGTFVRQFANGGPVLGTGNRDTVPALLMPGEYVLSRRDVSDIKRGAIGQAAGFGNLTVNIQNAPAGTEALVNQRRLADGVVLDVILRHRRDLSPLFGGA